MKIKFLRNQAANLPERSDLNPADDQAFLAMLGRATSLAAGQAELLTLEVEQRHLEAMVSGLNRLRALCDEQ